MSTIGFNRGKNPGLKLDRTSTENFSFSGTINESAFLYGNTPGGRKLADSVFNTAVSGPWARCVSWSPSGRYLAVGNTDTPFINVYYFDGQNFIKLNNPTTLPSSAVIDLAWTTDGKYLFLILNSSPFISVYTVSDSSGTSTLTWVKSGVDLASPALSKLTSIAMSPRGDQFVLGLEASPYYLLYDIRPSGTLEPSVFAEGVASPTQIVLPSAPFSCDWSPNGRYVAFTFASSPYLHVWELDDRSGWTKLANPTTLPDNRCYKVSFSPDNRYLAVSHIWGWRFSIFSLENSVLTKLSTMVGEPAPPAEIDVPPGTFPYSGDGTGHCWSPDGNFLVSGLDNVPYLVINRVYKNTVTRISFLATQTTKRPRDISWSPDGEYFALANSATNPVSVYKSYPGTVNTSTLLEISPPSNVPRI